MLAGAAPLPPPAPSARPAVPRRARILVICRLRRCALPYSWNTMLLLPAAAALPARRPQLSVEPKVPFLRSLAHLAFAAPRRAGPLPTAGTAQRGAARRITAGASSNPAKTAAAARRPPARAFANRNARREGAPTAKRESARAPTMCPCPAIVGRRKGGRASEPAIGDRKPDAADRASVRPSTGQCPERQGGRRSAPWYGGSVRPSGAAKTEVDAR